MQPFPNLISDLVANNRLVKPWIQFFQQFVSAPPPVLNVVSPYKTKEPGFVVVTGGGVITLTRGKVSITLTGQVIIPVSIADTVTAPSATLQFLPLYGASTTNG